MKIIQTFWSAGKNPINEPFGWFAPEYNLMSWAISCRCLRMFYNKVELYTDSDGATLLIGKLKLPYTDVHVSHDDFSCLPTHWALAKIKTYSLQTEPFIHVDGDVFLSKPFNENILNSLLVVQNEERVTDYYKKLIQRLLGVPGFLISTTMRNFMQKDSVPSYNMGVFGGCDTDFIRKYCKKVFDFVRNNHMNDIRCSNSSISCNVFLEQLFFAKEVEEAGKKVTPLICSIKNDNGYSVSEFCTLDTFDKSPYYHLLGGHKRNWQVLGMLKRLMIRKFPNEYLNILSLYPSNNKRFSKMDNKCLGCLNVEKSVAIYEDFLLKRDKEWSCLQTDMIFEMERRAAISITYLQENDAIEPSMTFSLCPYVSFFDIPINWHPLARGLLLSRLHCDNSFPLTAVAVTPTLINEGIRETPLDKTDRDIIAMLYEKQMSFSMLEKCISSNYASLNPSFQIGTRRKTESAVMKLLKKCIIQINNNKYLSV